MNDNLATNGAANGTQASGGVTDAARALTESVATVKQLLAAGLLDPTALGLSAPTPEPQPVAVEADDDATRQGSLPTWFLVPGEPIRVRDLMAKTRRGLKPETARAYGTYLDFLADGWTTTAPGGPSVQRYAGLGDRWAHEVLPSDLEEALGHISQRAKESAARRAAVRQEVGRTPIASTGVGARYNAVGAWRRAFAVAVKDRHLARQFNPAKEIEKPRRIAGKRRLLCLTILVAGARREGLMNLTLGGVDLEESTLRLDERFDKVVDQPVPDWLADRLHLFAVARGAHRYDDPVFRTRPRHGEAGTPISARRLDNIFQRVQSLLGWADKNQVTAHTLRHHAIALIERTSSRQVAIAFARHAPEDTNGLYGRASAKEVAQAVTRVHGGDHPWLYRDQEDD